MAAHWELSEVPELKVLEALDSVSLCRFSVVCQHVANLASRHSDELWRALCRARWGRFSFWPWRSLLAEKAGESPATTFKRWSRDLRLTSQEAAAATDLILATFPGFRRFSVDVAGAGWALPISDFFLAVDAALGPDFPRQVLSTYVRQKCGELRLSLDGFSLGGLGPSAEDDTAAPDTAREQIEDLIESLHEACSQTCTRCGRCEGVSIDRNDEWLLPRCAPCALMVRCERAEEWKVVEQEQGVDPREQSGRSGGMTRMLRCLPKIRGWQKRGSSLSRLAGLRYAVDESCHARKESMTWSSDTLDQACLPTSMVKILDALGYNDGRGSWSRRKLSRCNEVDADDTATAAVIAYLEAKTRQAEALFEPPMPEAELPFVYPGAVGVSYQEALTGAVEAARSLTCHALASWLGDPYLARDVIGTPSHPYDSWDGGCSASPRRSALPAPSSLEGRRLELFCRGLFAASVRARNTRLGSWLDH
eukprot:gnl/TRDRNA2_/TRDRNA2_157155_c0_seq3.p1 gnl/TRDRNA2_/TRDRNA2_157155_c0~~gnl/TRDRNA2_/TRDRNA2_157155_c0_seq3.p1  ORF type:complete len:479 (+),score=53.61 gnl/TRDRNA2_/TRDRNA2_157155_c0_seq3:148-1584(+)